jgi:hypothetical protein
MGNSVGLDVLSPSKIFCKMNVGSQNDDEYP